MRAGLFALLLVVGLATVGCRESPSISQHRIAAFGTEVEIVVRAGDTINVERAIAAVDRQLQTTHRRWHAWKPGRLHDINRAIAAGRSIEVPASMRILIERARRLERRSQGLFNPAIGGVLALWGFHDDALPRGSPPAAEAIADWLAGSPSLDNLSFEGNRLSSGNPAVQLDFNAYVKGVAVERALERLRAAGVEHAIVNAGGDLGVIGNRGTRAWRAAVQHPDGRGGQHLGHVEVLDGEFVFTSGNYRRYREDEGLRRGHIIDPRDGYPAGQVASVTVIHQRGGTADAAATALAVANPKEWQRVARRMGIDQVMRVDADGVVWVTPAMEARLHWPERPAGLRIVSLP